MKGHWHWHEASGRQWPPIGTAPPASDPGATPSEPETGKTPMPPPLASTNTDKRA